MGLKNSNFLLTRKCS